MTGLMYFWRSYMINKTTINFHGYCKAILTSKLTFLSSLVVLVFLLFISNSHSAIVETSSDAKKDRIRQCSIEGNPFLSDNTAVVRVLGINEKKDSSDLIDIKHNDGVNASEYYEGGIFGEDLDLDLQNPYCAISLGALYGSIKITQATMNASCKLGMPVKVRPAPLQDSVRMIRGHAQLAFNPSPACKASILAADTPFIAFTIYLETLYRISKNAFPHYTICGSDWMEYDPQTMTKSRDGLYKRELNVWVHDKTNKDKGYLTLANKKYREWYYGGIEMETDPSIEGSCKDPNRPGKGQRYYFRGLEPAIYNCDQYNLIRNPLSETSTATPEDYKIAYDCCIRMKNNHICIQSTRKKLDFRTNEKSKNNKLIVTTVVTAVDGSENEIPNSDVKAVMCSSSTGEKGKPQISNLCNIDGVAFSAEFQNNKTMICASSFDLCPYNFNIGGGNFKCDPYTDGSVTKEDLEKGICPKERNSKIRDGNCELNDFAGKCKNYCQPLEHCVMVDKNNYNYKSNITSPYFSTACIDFVGDSKNNLGYSNAISSGDQKHFSAPIAQCVKETVENVFFNRAGHTLCRNNLEIPNQLDECNTSGIIYKKGEQVPDRTNFFNRIQHDLKTIIQLVLIMSIVFTGYKILSGNQDALKRKELIQYIFKLAVVMYFVTGQAWQTIFFDGIYKASDGISQIVFKVTVSDDERKRDGCQFGLITDNTNAAVQTGGAYPKGKEYLAIWDSMDCKIARYLGMGLDADFTTMAQLILISALIPGFGTMFAALLMIFGVTLIIATIKMLHVFLLSAISIIILVYLSIIIIPLMLFKKTENLFKKWLSNLISLTLQPIILFAYIGIFVSVFDNVLLGSATFNGDPPRRNINCKDRCITIDGTEKEQNTGTRLRNREDRKNFEAECDTSKEVGDIFLSPSTDSVACIVTNNDPNVKKWPGLQVIGVGLPMLGKAFTKDGRVILGKQMATMLKGALIIFILSSFIGSIPETAQALVGGVQLKMSDITVKGAMARLAGGLKALAKRGGKVAQKAPGGIKRAVSSSNNSSKPPN